jgi:hypothetical protein
MNAQDSTRVVQIEENQPAPCQRQPWHAPKLMVERVSVMTASHSGSGDDVHPVTESLS